MPPERETKSAPRPGPTLFDPGPWVHPSHLFRRSPPASPSAAIDRATPPPVAPAPPTAAAPAVVETAEELFQKLQALHAAGRFRVELDTKHLIKIDSPVSVEAEGNIWVYGFAAASVVLGFALGWTIGLAAGGLGIVFYLTLGKAFISRRIERRVREKALAELSLWRKLWSYGGVVLATTSEGSERCAAPDGNWLEFVRSLSRA